VLLGLNEEEERVKQLPCLLCCLVVLAAVILVVIICQNLLRILSAAIVLEVLIGDLESEMAYVLRALSVSSVTVFPPVLNHTCICCILYIYEYNRRYIILSADSIVK